MKLEPDSDSVATMTPSTLLPDGVMIELTDCPAMEPTVNHMSPLLLTP